jgi:DNA-binding XRE family transcriptional regulator
MSKIEFITTPSGDRMAVMPLAEYERLVEAAENADDVRAYDRAKRKLARGADELLPATMVNRVLAGENKVRVWREYRGLAVKALAKAAKIAPAYLSQIEAGDREGSVATLRKIAASLRVDLDDIA